MCAYDPFRHMLEDYRSCGGIVSGGSGDTWSPPTDVYETESEIIIKMSLPGVEAEDIGVTFDGGTITVCGRRQAQEEDDITSYHQMEIRNGYFKRKIVIHKAINPDGVRAYYDNGFLKIHVPRAQHPTEKAVTIRLSF